MTWDRCPVCGEYLEKEKGQNYPAYLSAHITACMKALALKNKSRPAEKVLPTKTAGLGGGSENAVRS